MSEADVAGPPDPNIDGLEFRLKETLVSPLGVQINKIDRPDGKKEVHIIMIEGFPAGPGAMVPTEMRAYRFSESQARAIANQIVGGVVIARPGEVPPLR